MRQTLLVVHRWAGLLGAAFLFLAGITGTVIAYEEELESWLNPGWFVVEPPRDASGNLRPMLDPFELREQVQRALPDYVVNLVRFNRKPDRSQVLFLRPRPGVEVANDQVFVDPYSGEILGMRKYGESLFKRQTAITFIYDLHHSLALPGAIGGWILGIVAIVWMFDSFIGLILTLPRGRPFMSKWSVAWKIKRNAAPLRLNMDLHRAFSLWLFVVLLLFAVSSVMLNLRQEVFRPVMSTVFDFSPQFEAPRRAQPLDQPTLDYRAAAARGERVLQALAQEKHFTVNYPDSVTYNRNGGFYIYLANTSRDIVRNRGQTAVYFDANSGAMLGWRIQTGEAAGDTISRWLQSLHMAQIWGWPYQLFVALIGLVVAMLSVTGVVIWWSKRRARVSATRRTRAASQALPLAQ